MPFPSTNKIICHWWWQIIFLNYCASLPHVELINKIFSNTILQNNTIKNMHQSQTQKSLKIKSLCHLFFTCLSFVFRPFLSLYTFIPFYILIYLIYFLNYENVKKLKICLVWRSSVNKKRNITTKPVGSVWFIHFSTSFYHIYIYIYIYEGVHRSTSLMAEQKQDDELCEDTGCSPEDLPEAMNDREKWRESFRDIRAGGTTWWWLYIYIYIYIYRGPTIFFGHFSIQLSEYHRVAKFLQ